MATLEISNVNPIKCMLEGMNGGIRFAYRICSSVMEACRACIERTRVDLCIPS